MPRRDRLTIIRILEKLRTDEVEQTGLVLSELTKEADQLEQHSRDLTEKSLKEARQSTEETRAFLPVYLDAVTKTQRRLEDQRALTEERVEEIRSRLHEKFREAKIMSVAREQLEASEGTDARMLEGRESDEAGRIGHLLFRR